jgi:hypothetical protein
VTLEPLRAEGPDALSTDGFEEISRIVLVEIEVAWDNEFRSAAVRKADDIFGCAAAEEGAYDPIPREGRLVQAIFALECNNIAEPQYVQVRPPGAVTVSENCDVTGLERWLLKSGFALPHARGMLTYSRYEF